MLKKQTVFVIGAGASAEFGLPVGSELQRQIAALVNMKFDDFGYRQTSGDQRLFEALKREHAGDVNAFVDAGWHIHDAVGLSHSIDNFMDSHHTDARIVKVGKLGIVRAITKAERQSKLFIDPSNVHNDLNFDAVRDAWISKLFVSMQEGIRSEAVKSFFERAAFIIFNYDRCVEHFFFRALSRMYQLGEAAAAQLVNEASIAHPYGTVGQLPWQARGANATVAFGNLDPDLAAMARGIRTYTERAADSREVERIKRLMYEADTICFLGFSYQRQNMELLSPPMPARATQVLASAFHMSDYDIKSIREDIATRLQLDASKVNVDNLTCASFLQKYDRAFR